MAPVYREPGDRSVPCRLPSVGSVSSNARLFRLEPCRFPILILACIVYGQVREISRIAPAPDFPFDPAKLKMRGS